LIAESKKNKKESSKQERVNALLAKYKDDKKFQEFLRVHKRNAIDGWTNDNILQVGKEFSKQNLDQEGSDSNKEDDSEGKA